MGRYGNFHAALDRYITGNYGEDLEDREEAASVAFKLRCGRFISKSNWLRWLNAL